MQELCVSVLTIICSCVTMASKYRRLALLIILPTIQITCFTETIGGDLKDVKLLYTNDDNCKYIYTNGRNDDVCYLHASKPHLSSREKCIGVDIICIFIKYSETQPMQNFKM